MLCLSSSRENGKAQEEKEGLCTAPLLKSSLRIVYKIISVLFKNYFNYFPPGLSLRGGPALGFVSHLLQEDRRGCASHLHGRCSAVEGKPHLAFGQRATALCSCCPAKDKEMFEKKKDFSKQGSSLM